MKFLINFLFFIIFFNCYSQNNNYDYLIEKSLMHIELEEYNEGRGFAQEAYKIDPKRGEAYYCLALIKLDECKKKNNKSCNEGLFFIEKLDKLSHYKKTNFIKGSLQALTKDYEGSVESFTKAIALEPKKGYYFYNRAYSLSKLGNNELSCIDLKKSCNLGYDGACKLISKKCGDGLPR